MQTQRHVESAAQRPRLIGLRWSQPIALCLVLSSLLALVGGCTRAEPGVRVILITLDTLRLDSFAGEGEAEGSMPALAAWAETSTVFDRFFSATSSTQPSHVSMLTGLHPWQHGITRNGQRLPAELDTVPEQLRAAGFSTAAVVASFPVSSSFAFDQGFDHFDDDFSLGRPGSEWRADAEAAAQDGDGSDEEANAPGRFYSLANDISERALALLDDASGDKQFFWFHYFDPHSPYGDTAEGGAPEGGTITPSRILGLVQAGEPVASRIEQARALYDLDVAFLDRHLARLLERLEDDGERYTTHIVVVADHGESFGEDGSLAHGRRLTPGQIHVPLIIRSPLLPAGRRAEVTGSVDVAPTLLSLAGVSDGTSNRASAGPGSGRDLLASPDRPARAFGMRRTYREPYLDRRLDGSVVTLDSDLFYLADRDGKIYRGNSGMLLPPAPGVELSEQLQRQLTHLFAAFEQELAGRSTEELMDDETRKALKALGYVG